MLSHKYDAPHCVAVGGKGQTSKPTGYNFSYTNKAGETVKVLVVDTPGLSDPDGRPEGCVWPTVGMQHDALALEDICVAGRDDEHLDNITKFATTLQHLNAVLLIVNGTAEKDSVTIRNVFVRLRGHLPDSVLDNVLVCFTNCTSCTR